MYENTQNQRIQLLIGRNLVLRTYLHVWHGLVNLCVCGTDQLKKYVLAYAG